MLQYDVVKNFEPASLLADTPMWILPAKDLKGVRRNAPAADRRRKAKRSNSSAAVAAHR
jgi:hypothetical protein